MDERHIRRGEVYYADLRPTVGSEQDGVRPVLVIQNDAGNKRGPTVIVAAITSRQTKPHIPIKLLYLIHMEGIPDKENDRFTACGGNCRIPCDAKYTTSHVAEAI